jgi:hypothetical protein
MPEMRYESIRVTGVANDEAFADPLESQQNNVKHVVALLVQVEDYAECELVVDIDQDRILEIPIELLDTDADSGGTNTMYSTSKMQRVEIDRDIPIGADFSVGISCGATDIDLTGAIQYYYQS